MEKGIGALHGIIVEAHIPDQHGEIQHILTAEKRDDETTEGTLGRIGFASFNRALTPSERTQSESVPGSIAYRTKQTTNVLPPLT